MKRLFLAVLLSGLSMAALSAEVVQPAPDIQWINASGGRQGLSALKGQPILVVVAPSPRSWAFRSQVGQLQKMYQRFAAGRLVCVAAFTSEPGLIRSNIPFLVAADGPRVAYDFQMGERFGLALIGPDGNVDYVTDRVQSAQRIFDVINNSYVPQSRLRRR